MDINKIVQTLPHRFRLLIDKVIYLDNETVAW